MDVEPQRCLVIEDSASGFKAARTAGMPYIAITFGADPHELTEAGDAKGVFEDFSKIDFNVIHEIMKR